MNAFEKILVPVDLSDYSRDAIKLATNLAKCNQAKLVFCFVALPTLPPEALYGKPELDALLLEEHGHFKQIRPTDLEVEYEHLFLRGNPGPELLQAANDNHCDLIVMATHGRTGISRWLMGSVAEYVTRNATVPVLTLKMPREHEPQPNRVKGFGKTAKKRSSGKKTPFVTSAMVHSPPIHDYDEMTDVAVELKATKSTAAPVIDCDGECIGILTETDLAKYFELQRRLEANDPTVIDEVFETDEYGLRRTNSVAFQRVKRHMTSPVVTISANEDCQTAADLFQQHPAIHHLIVVDNEGRPLGVVEPKQLEQLSSWNVDEAISLDR